jgi:hypothetical protein
MAEGTSDSRQVLGILKDARGLVDRAWVQGSRGQCQTGEASGGYCASVSITCAQGYDEDYAAHKAFLRATGIPVPTRMGDMLNAVYAFNDAQTSKAPVLAAFDKAITALENEIACDALMAELAEAEIVLPPEPTPLADATIEVILAIEECGTVLARQIVSAHPQMDEREVRSMCCADLFSAAKDAAWACDMGVVIERGERDGWEYMGFGSIDDADAGSWS